MKISLKNLHGKSVEKLVVKLLKHFHLKAANIAPRFIKSRQESSLRYIVYQRFKNAEISEEGYFDFVRVSSYFVRSKNLSIKK